MRTLGLLLSLLLHVVVALAIPARAKPIRAATPQSPERLVWLARPEAVRHRPMPAPPSTAHGLSVGDASATAPRPLPGVAPARRAAPSRPRRAVGKPPPRPPVSLSASPAGVAVPAADEQPLTVAAIASGSAQAFVAASAVGQADAGDPARGAGEEPNGGSGGAPVELDGRSGSDNTAVSAWLHALRAHLRRCHHYPDWLAERGLQGTIEVRLLIYADGRLGEVKPVGSGNPLLLQAAREVLVDAGRLPRPPDSLGPAVRVRMPLNFRLEEP